jgi:hypothetical protein
MDWDMRRALVAGVGGRAGIVDALCVLGRAVRAGVRCVVVVDGDVVLGALRGARNAVDGAAAVDAARSAVGLDEQPATTATVATAATATLTWPTMTGRPYLPAQPVAQSKVRVTAFFHSA